jgi:hypothetical protein
LFGGGEKIRLDRIESERFANAREAAPVNGECAERL